MKRYLNGARDRNVRKCLPLNLKAALTSSIASAGGIPTTIPRRFILSLTRNALAGLGRLEVGWHGVYRAR